MGVSRTEKAIGAACRKEAKTSVVCDPDRVPAAGVGLKLLRVKEYAALYGVCESTVREWIRNGKVQFEQPAGKRGRIFIHA